MKRSEELELRLNALKEEDKQNMNMVFKEAGAPRLRDFESVWSSYWDKFGRETKRKMRELEDEIYKEKNREIKEGDGVTYHLYSDSHACTVIKKTKQKIIMQQDKATRDPSFEPKFIVGGFAAHCVNQNEQKWLYERDNEGAIIEARWNEKHGAFMYCGKPVTLGRHEFYDYNF